MSNNDHRSNDEALVNAWRRARDSAKKGQNSAVELDPLLLAAYLDGTLDAQECAEVEASLAASPEAMDLMVAVRQAQSASPPQVPDSVLRRAQGLVPGGLVPEGFVPDPRAFTAATPSWLERLTAPIAAAFQPTVWAGATMAVLLACMLGFQLGQVGYDQLAAVDSLLQDSVALGFDRPDDDLF